MDNHYIVPERGEQTAGEPKDTGETVPRVITTFPADGTCTPDLIMEEDASSEVSAENRLNTARLRGYKARFGRRLLELIRESEFEFGYDSPVDVFLRDRLEENALATKEWLNWLFIENFHDVEVAAGILRVVGHFGYQAIAPQGPTIALAALSHVSAEVRECGIRAFENWGTAACLRILKNVSCAEKWLKEYVSQVVSDLEELPADVPARQKD